jgi:hypothetical protein
MHASNGVPKVGVVFASTGGFKTVRAIRSFRVMEPSVLVYALIDMTTKTWQANRESLHDIAIHADILCALFENRAFVNGGMNHAVRWMKAMGHSYACVFHDDLVFSPLAEHRHSLSYWFDSDILARSSGISFAHFEALVRDPGANYRRKPERWDEENMESEALWRFLASTDIVTDKDICPPDASYFFRYEGPDVVRKWNRLGPSGYVVPIATWEALGGFDETSGVFYDDFYSTECLLRGFPPIYAVNNFPYIHLHNQSVNPWADVAEGVWGDSGQAFTARYGASKPGIWRDDWEARWT